MTIELPPMPKPTPAEMTSAFDCGTWAAIRSLMAVLRQKNILDMGDFAAVLEGMLAVAKEHADKGEVQREAAVREAAEDLSFLSDPIRPSRGD